MANLQRRYSEVAALLLRARYLMGDHWPESKQLLQQVLDRLVVESQRDLDAEPPTS